MKSVVAHDDCDCKMPEEKDKKEKRFKGTKESKEKSDEAKWWLHEEARNL